MSSTTAPALVVLCLSVLVSECLAQSGSSYCSIDAGHTMCRFSGPDHGQCGQVLARGMSDQQKAAVLQHHNELRSIVASGSESRGQGGSQPPAADMRQLEWDEELSTIAQRWIEQCRFEHDCGRCRHVDRFRGVGQNLFMGVMSGTDDSLAKWKEAVRGWYDEVEMMNPQHVDSFPTFTSAMIGHYTAMLWADTYRVGCGYVNFRRSGRDHKAYACNYGPGGNIVGRPVYRTGSPCSACPSGTSCSGQYRNLCSAAGGGSSQDLIQQPQNSFEQPQNQFQQPQSPFQQAHNSFQKPQNQFQRPQNPFRRPQNQFQQPQNQFQRPQNQFQRPQRPFQRPQRPFQHLQDPASSVTSVTVPDSVPSISSQSTVTMYIIRPDSSTGCFRFGRFLFCQKDPMTWMAVRIGGERGRR